MHRIYVGDGKIVWIFGLISWVAGILEMILLLISFNELALFIYGYAYMHYGTVGDDGISMAALIVIRQCIYMGKRFIFDKKKKAEYRVRKIK